METTPWLDDRLHRKADAEHLTDLLKERYQSRQSDGLGSYILNIDASWGQGKTYFLSNLRQQLRCDGHIVGYVNAWKDDHGDDPLTAIMASIDEQLSPFFDDATVAKLSFERGKRALGIVAGETAKQVGYHILKSVTGIAVEATIAKLSEAGALSEGAKIDPDAFDEAAEKIWEKGLSSLLGERIAHHQKSNKAVAEFRNQTAKAIAAVFEKNMKPPMFVFIDELDRCRPLYAIKLLENLKHLFEIEGLVFVVATDSEQLAHSVKAIYGADFEARKYLRRFFDRVFVFPDASRRDFIEYAFRAAGISIEDSFFATSGVPPLTTITNWADDLVLSNRDVVQVVDIIGAFVSSFSHKVKIEPNLLLAFVAAFYFSDHGLLKKIAEGSVPEQNALSRWQVLKMEPQQTTGRMGQVKVPWRQALQPFHDYSRRSLSNLTNAQMPFFLLDYFRYEVVELYGRGHDGFDPKSVIREYPSRVTNAGRVIDR